MGSAVAVDETEDAAPECYGALRTVRSLDCSDDMERLANGLMTFGELWRWIGRNLREVEHTTDRYGRRIVRIRFRLVNEDEMWTSGLTIEDAIETARTYQRTAERLAYKLDGAA